MRTMSKGLKPKLFGLLGGMSICALAVQPAAAATIHFWQTGTGSDGALAASAHFTTSGGLLSVTITNTLAASQIRSAGQAVSDLIFTLSNAPGTLGATSASGQLANIGGTTAAVTNVSGTPTAVAGPRPSPSRPRFFQHCQVTPSRWRRSEAVSQVRCSYLPVRVSQMPMAL